ncbi:MAG: hypothetical protein M0Z75_10915, partial [Nitrospiraceae bacterium]|nr:hypothetical protein [Nitrospiraceae bacterium]
PACQMVAIASSDGLNTYHQIVGLASACSWREAKSGRIPADRILNNGLILALGGNPAAAGLTPGTAR